MATRCRAQGVAFAWGANYDGQLGTDGAPYSVVPGLVNRGGLLSDKTIIAIAGGDYHSLALDTTGQVYAWGLNDSGQLGSNSTAVSALPSVVYTGGVLFGKTITAIGAGYNFSLALDSSGHVYAWGADGAGELGNNSTAYYSAVPVAVDISSADGSALADKTVVAIAAGYAHKSGGCTVLLADP